MKANTKKVIKKAVVPQKKAKSSTKKFKTCTLVINPKHFDHLKTIGNGNASAAARAIFDAKFKIA